MKICPVCGRTYDVNATFCAECGVALTAQQPAPVTAPSPVAMVYTVPAAPEKKESAIPVSVALFTFFNNFCNILAGMFTGLYLSERGDMLDAGLVFAIFGSMAGIVGIILTACQKVGAYYIFSRIAGLILSIALMIVISQWA